MDSKDIRSNDVYCFKFSYVQVLSIWDNSNRIKYLKWKSLLNIMLFLMENIHQGSESNSGNMQKF